MKDPHEMPLVREAMRADECVIVPWSHYRSLVELENRAVAKLAQLTANIQPDTDTAAYIRCLKWLLGSA